MSDIGEKIKRARHIKGLTQSDLASKVGCSVNTISRWEHDKNIPSKKDMDRLSVVLGVEIETNETLPIHPAELALEELRNEYAACRKRMRWYTAIFIAIVLLLLIALIVYVIGTQTISGDTPERPVKVIYYDVEKGEGIS